MDTTYILSIDAPSLTTLVETELPDNTEGLITPQSLRTVFNCVIDTIDQNHNIEKVETNNFSLNLPSSIIQSSCQSINIGFGDSSDSLISDSCQSFVSGVDNKIYGSWLGEIEMGRENTLSGSGNSTCSSYYNSSIKNSWFSTISNSYGSQIINSRHSSTTCSGYSIILNGFYSNITDNYGAFVQGANNCVINGGDGMIIGGFFNNINFPNPFNGSPSTIFNSTCSSICGDNNHIISSGFSCIVKADSTGPKNTIIGSMTSCIINSCNSHIIGGVGNTISGRLNTYIIGDSITATRDCSTFVNNLNIMSIPTSSAGLPSGSVWRCTVDNTLRIVP